MLPTPAAALRESDLPRQLLLLPARLPHLTQRRERVGVLRLFGAGAALLAPLAPPFGFGVLLAARRLLLARRLRLDDDYPAARPVLPDGHTAEHAVDPPIPLHPRVLITP